MLRTPLLGVLQAIVDNMPAHGVGRSLHKVFELEQRRAARVRRELRAAMGGPDPHVDADDQSESGKSGGGDDDDDGGFAGGEPVDGSHDDGVFEPLQRAAETSGLSDIGLDLALKDLVDGVPIQPDALLAEGAQMHGALTAAADALEAHEEDAAINSATVTRAALCTCGPFPTARPEWRCTTPTSMAWSASTNCRVGSCPRTAADSRRVCRALQLGWHAEIRVPEVGAIAGSRVAQ